MPEPIQPTGPHWAWLNSPEGDAALAILESWLDSVDDGRPVVSVVRLYAVMRDYDFPMNDYSNFRRWLKRSYGPRILN